MKNIKNRSLYEEQDKRNKKCCLFFKILLFFGFMCYETSFLIFLKFKIVEHNMWYFFIVFGVLLYIMWISSLRRGTF